MTTPVIGITSYVEPVTRTPWVDQLSAVLPHDYVQHVERAGGIALVIPPRVDADDTLVDALLDHLDGLILSGGVDVDPLLYADRRHSSVQESRPDRDSTELRLARRATERGVPLLGICRGMQVMAVAVGGTLEQHIPDRVGHEGHSPVPGVYAAHPVRVDPASRLAGLLGDHLDVPTYHHQSVLTHPGYRAAAWTDDGTVEAMEPVDDSGAFRFAVQWHPEMSQDNRLFAALVDAARTGAEGGGSSR